MPDTVARIVFRDELSGAEVACRGRGGDSLLEIALRHGLSIEHTCGGIGACSTCHLWIIAGHQVLTPPDDNELDRLDEAPGVRLDSRLGCQARIGGSAEIVEIVCIIPRWNRNLVRETP